MLRVAACGAGLLAVLLGWSLAPLMIFAVICIVRDGLAAFWIVLAGVMVIGLVAIIAVERLGTAGMVRSDLLRRVCLSCR